MFNSIEGIITTKNIDSIFILTSGIEWQIQVPNQDLNNFSHEGERARVFTWLHHWEDGMRLYGFSSQDQREVFLGLIKVDGIGPRQAIKIMSSIDPDSLIDFIENDNLKALQSIHGIGAKTAQKIIMTLKGKFDLLRTSGRSNAKSNNFDDIIKALVEMGYDKKNSEDIVKRVSKEISDEFLESESDRSVNLLELESRIFKKALIFLSTEVKHEG